MSYTNAGPIVLTDSEYVDSPTGAVTAADLDNLVAEFDVEFSAAYDSGYVYLGDITDLSPGSDVMIIRMQPDGTNLNFFFTEQNDYSSTVIFSPPNSSPQPLALNTVGTVRITHNASRLLSIYLNDVLVDSGIHPNVLDMGVERFHLGFGGAGNVTFTNVNVSSTVVNSDPVLDTPQPDIIVSETVTGVIADISSNFSDADSDTLTYSVTPALPAGMTLNTTTGVISGNGSISVTAATDHTFTADDGQGGTPANDIVSIEVVAISYITEITFDANDFPNLLPGNYLMEVESDDGVISYSNVPVELPAGWNIIQSNGTAGTDLADHYLATYGTEITSDDYYVTENFVADASGNVVSGIGENVRFWNGSQNKYTTESQYSSVSTLELNASAPSISLNAAASQLETGAEISLESTSASIAASGNSSSLDTKTRVNLESTSDSISISGSSALLNTKAGVNLESTSAAISASGSSSSLETKATINLSGTKSEVSIGSSNGVLLLGRVVLLEANAASISINSSSGSIETKEELVLEALTVNASVSSSSANIVTGSILELSSTAPACQVSSSASSLETHAHLVIEASSAALGITSITATLALGDILTTRFDIGAKGLKTSGNYMYVAKRHNNKVSMIVEYEGEPLDMNLFDLRFELYGLSNGVISSDANPSAISIGSEPGEIILDVGLLTSASGAIDTTLVGFGSEYEDGVVLWNKNFTNSNVRAIVLE